jgi:serine/threonine protein kinase/formylglycine-generating enzyme required for sulfatase activity
VTEASIFTAALDLADPAEREAYLAGACGADAALRGRVDGLLAAHAAAGTFLERPAAAPDPDTTWPAPDGPPPGDGMPFLAPPRRPDSLGRIGHYEVLEVLGKGGFGIVFRAFDEVLQRVVAVKVLAPQMAATSPARKRFLREARSSAQVRHENVVAVHAVEEQPLPYLVMEFIPGETLQQRLDRTGPLDLPEILRVGRQIAEGLAAAHGTGLVHRDVKPANVMIEAGPGGRVKLTDFGLARAADDASISQSGVVAGTPMYMAPEQARGDTLDHRADLFSLGSVLYVMCTGRPPFRASGTLAVLKRVCEEAPRPIREVIPEVPEWLCRIVEKLHAKDPAERYQSAREAADVLADCERQVAAHGGLRDFSRVPGGKPRGRSRRRWAAAAVALVVAGGLAAGLHAWNQPPPRGSLTIRTNDPGMIVTLDDTVVLFSHVHVSGGGVDWTHTGSVSRDIAPGEYRVRAMRDGRVFREEIVTVADGEHRVVEFLAPPPAGPAADGWVQLFNGKDLTGWKTHPDLPGTWEVRDGVLTGSGGQSYLFSERGDFGNFHLRAEVRVTAVGDSGIRFRAPFALRRGKEEWQVGPAGGYEADINAAAAGTVWKADRPPAVLSRAPAGLIRPGEWFTLEVVADGNRFVTKVDGQVAADGADPLDGDRVGHFALQFWGPRAVAEFRKVEVKELPPSPPADAFTPLFNGTDLSGWKQHPDAPGDWRVEDGAIVGRGDTSFLFSDREYADFHLRVEAMVNPGGDSGVFFRVPFAVAATPKGRPTLAGYLSQLTVRQDWAAHTGSLMTRFPDYVRAPLGLHRAGEWFVLEVIARGNHLQTLVNGKPAAEYRDEERRFARGHLALQVWGNNITHVRFRKVEVKELPSPAPPLAVAPFDAAAAEAHQEAWAAHLGVPVRFANDAGMAFRLIPPGEFRMGTSGEEAGAVLAAPGVGAWTKAAVESEKPKRPERIPAAFYLATTEVTHDQFKRFVAATGHATEAERNGKGGSVLDADRKFVTAPEWTWKHPQFAADGRAPVVQVTTEDAEAFCRWLGRTDGRTYRLPTEAEWEFACRAGTTGHWWTGDRPDRVGEVEWTADNSLQKLHPVGTRGTNPFGLHDMLGSVEEICRRPAAGGEVARGGNGRHPVWLSRSATRWPSATGTAYFRRGFRVLLAVGGPDPKPGPAAGPVDLLARIDPERDALQGAWKWDGRVLDSPAPLAQLQVPFAPPEHYRLTMEVERTTPPGALTFGLIVGGKTACVALDYNAPVKGGLRSGLAGLDGKVLHKREAAFDGPVLGPGRNTVVAEVRGNRVTVRVGETGVVDWEGDPDRFTVSPTMAKTDGKRLYLGHLAAGFRFHRLELTPLPPPDARPAVAPEPRPVP